MAEIEMQDFQGEVQSPAIAGIVEALSRISGSMDMKTEHLEKVALSPVPGLNASDPRRIYQAPGGSRLWLSYPEPTVYLNNAPVSSGDLQYSIDYIGGSITFNGDYKPSDSDQLSVSCTHISEGSYNSGGCELKITFSAGFAGMSFTVTSSAGESYSGVVPSSLVAYVSVKNTNTEYTITAYDASSKPHVTSVTTGQYYGQYEASINVFTATILVTAVSGANITVKDSLQATYTKVAGEDGKAAFYVTSPDNYTVTAEYNGINSDTQVVNVSDDGGSYSAVVNFITLLVTVESGSTVKVKNGLTTLSDTSDGTVLFYLPNTGVWTVTASKGDKSAETTVDVSSYRRYTAELAYETPISNVLDDNDWATIRQVADSGQASSYWDVGDQKKIVLNGTVALITLNSFEIYAFIIGFNHNSQKEGNNTIHFQIGKISNRNIAFVDSYYSKFIMTKLGFAMDQTGAHSGWSTCDMRTKVLGNSSSPSSPTANSFMSVLPSDLRSVMKNTTKYTDNVGVTYAGESAPSSNVTSSSEYLFLLSEFELRGDTNLSNAAEKSSQNQYEYYLTGNSNMAYKHTSQSEESIVWLRSPAVHALLITFAPPFCASISTASASDLYGDATRSVGICPCFVV